MTPFQTDRHGGGVADPYVTLSDRGNRNRLGRQALGIRFDHLESYTARIRAIGAVADLAKGDLSFTRISISHSRVKELRGLSEMLQSMVSVLVKPDPYIEIEEPIRLRMSESRYQRPTKHLAIAATRKLERKASLEEFLKPVLRLEKLGRTSHDK